MSRRLLVGYLLITLFVLAVHDIPFMVTVASADRDRLSTAVERDASVMATYVVRELEHGQHEELQTAVAEYQRRTGARVVITDAQGWSVADTDHETGHGGEDFSTRPEIAKALSGERATGSAGAARGAGGFASVAVPVASAGTVYGVVNITYPTGEQRGLRQRVIALILSDLVTLAAVAVFGQLMSTSVTNPLKSLRHAAASLAGGDLDSRAEARRGPREVRALAQTFNTMATRLSALVAAQREFVGDASHQLRTPLTALHLRLQRVRAQVSGDPAVSAALDVALDEAARFNRLVEGLLTLARAEGSTPDRQAIAVTELLSTRRDLWEPLAAERRVPIQLDAAPGLTIMVAEGAVEQILDNLIANAIEVAPPLAPLVLRAVERDDFVVLEVADRGPGMTAEERRRAFDRFWRGTSSKAGQGSGLGLPIVRQLALANGGDAELAANPGGGLLVAVRLERGPNAPGARHGVRQPKLGRILANAQPTLFRSGATLEGSQLRTIEETSCAYGSTKPSVSATGSARTSAPASSDSTAPRLSYSDQTGERCERVAREWRTFPKQSSTLQSKRPRSAPPPASTWKRAEAAMPAVISRFEAPSRAADGSSQTFEAMGTHCHVAVVGGPPGLGEFAQRRVADLESRWSRFRPDSEISRLDRADGRATRLSEETYLLVSRAVDAWRVTEGAFDPTVIDALTAHGYDRSFEHVPENRQAPTTPARPTPGCSGIGLDPARRTVRLPPGVGFDPGGIGKGLAADFVVAELLAAGATGACANLGGDTVCRGDAPTALGWQIGVADPYHPDELHAVLGMAWGAVATSTRLQRQWQRAGRHYHHLVDPRTGQPSDRGIDSVTIVASSGWWAEVVAKAAFIAGCDEAASVVARLGGTGLLVSGGGAPIPLPGLEPYLA